MRQLITALKQKPWIRRQLLPLHKSAQDLRSLADDIRLILRHWHNNAIGIGRSPRDRKIVMLVISDLRIDPRVEREARALADAGYRVHIIYPDTFSPPGDHVQIDWGRGVTFEPLPWQAASFTMRFPGMLGRELLAAALAHRPFAFHGHDLVTALAVLLAARSTGAHAVCDFHEWFSENVEWDVTTERYVAITGFKKRVWRAVERRSLRHASAVITVCDSIARDLETHFAGGRPRVQVIRNIPSLSASSTQPYLPLKEQLGLPSDCFVVLWQGGTGPTRLIEPIIQSLVHEPRATLVIRGPSLDLFGDGYRSLAKSARVEDRLVLLPPVPSRDVVAAARGADAGIWSLPALCKNFTYALPNKIFEYLAAGVPVLAANYPEAKRLIQDNGVGLCFDPYDPKSIAATMTAMMDQAEAYAAMTARIPGLLSTLDAAKEWQKVVAVYDRIGAAAKQRQATP